MELSNFNIKNGLCISLGANVDSKFGNPISSLIKSRSMVENILKEWIIKFNDYDTQINKSNTNFYWSSLYESNPHGISEFQPNYINTLLLLKSDLFPKPTLNAARNLLNNFKELEKKFGRDKLNQTKKWLPRCLDLDILWWENLYSNNEELKIPHPRFVNRNFVITPLAEILNRDQEIKKLNISQWKV